MRQHRDTILSVLETFVHDPLVEWAGKEGKAEAEGINPMAQDALTTMQGRVIYVMCIYIFIFICVYICMCVCVRVCVCFGRGNGVISGVGGGVSGCGCWAR